MASNVEIILRGTDNASGPIRQVKGSLDDLHGTAKSAGGGIAGALGNIGQIAMGVLTAQAIPAIAGMAGAAITAGADFGAVMNRIQAVSGATSQELAAMNAKAMELGAALPISAKDAADAMYALVTAGYSASDAIAASTGVAQLASSQMMGVGQASEIVSAALRGFGLEAGQASHVVDILSQTASKSAVEVTDIGNTLKYVGPVAGALKQPIEDVAAAIALMGNAGIKGEMAGTALRTTLSNLISPTDGAAAAMGALGITVVDSAGNMLPLMDIMGQFRDKTASWDSAARANLATTVAGKEAMSGFLAVLTAAPADFDGMRESMAQAEGATARFAEAMNKGFKFEWEQLKGSIETVLIQGFQAVEPVLAGVTGAATGLVNALGDGMTQAAPTISMVASAIDDVVNAVVNGGNPFGQLIDSLGETGLLSDGLAGILGALATVFDTVTGSSGVLSSSLSDTLGAALTTAGEIGQQVFDALPGLVLAVQPSLQQIASTVESVLGTAVSAFGGVAQAVFDALPGVIDAVLAVLQSVAEFVTGTLASGFTTLGPIAEAIFEGIGTVVVAVMPGVAALAEAVGTLLAAAFDALRDVAVAVFSAIQPYVPQLQAAIGTLAQVIGGVLGTALTAAANFVTGTVVPALVTLAGWLAANLPGAIQTLVGFWTGALLPAIQTVAGWVSGTLFPLFAQLVGWLGSTITGALAALSAFWQQHGATILAVAQTAWNTIQGVIQSVLGTITGLWQAFQAAREGDWRGFGEKLRDIWDASWEAIKNVITAAGPKMVAALVALLNDLKTAFASVDWLELGRNIIQGVANGMGAAGEALRNAAQTAARNALDALKGALGISSPSRLAAEQVGVPIAQGIAAGLSSGLQSGTLGDALSPVKDTLVQFGSFMVQVARQIGNMAAGAIDTGALSRLSEGIGSIATALVQLQGVLQTISDLGIVDTSTNAKNTIAHLVIFVHDIVVAAGPARGDIGTDIPGPFRRLAEAFASVLSILQGLNNTLKLVGDLTKDGLDPRKLTAASDALQGLVGAAATLATVAANAALGVGHINTNGLTPLKGALDVTLGVSKEAFDLAKTLAEALAFDWSATEWGRAPGMLAWLVTQAGEWVKVAATAALGMKDVDTSGLAPLKAAVDSTLGVAKGAFELAKLLGETLAFDWTATEWSTAAGMMTGLATLAVYLVRGAAQAALAIKDVDASGLAPLKTATESTLGVAKSAFELAKTLGEALAYDWSATEWSDAAAMMTGLATLAVYLMRGAATAALAIKDVDTSGLAPLKSAVETTLGVAKGTFELAKTLGAALDYDWSATEWSTARDMLAGLATLATYLVNGAATATTQITLLDTSGLAPLKTALDTTLGVAKGTFDLAVLLGKALSDDTRMPDEASAERVLAALVRLGTSLADAATVALGTWTSTVNPALDALNKILSASLSGLKSTIDIVNLLSGGTPGSATVEDFGWNGADFLPTAMTPNRTPLQMRVMQIVSIGRELADAASVALGTWTGTVNPALTALGKLLGDSLGVLKGTLDIVNLLSGNGLSGTTTIDAFGWDPADFLPSAMNPSRTPLQLRIMQLVSLGRELAEAANVAIGSWSTEANPALTELAKVLSASLSIFKNTLDILIALNTEYTTPVDAKAAVTRLTTIGLEIAGEFGRLANTYTETVTPAATAAVQSLDMATKFVKDVFDLGKAFTQSPPQVPLNLADLIKQFVALGKQVATAFSEEANSFNVTVGPGTKALLDVYKGLGTFFGSINQAANAVAKADTLPDDFADKVRTLTRTAIDAAREFITQTNGFDLSQGQGALNLESVIGGFADLVKDTKDILKTLKDFGVEGVQSDQIAQSLAVFATILQGLQGLSIASGTTAGVGFMESFAAAITANGDKVRSALAAVLAGVIGGGTGGNSAPGGTGGGTGGGVTNVTNNYYTTKTNNITITTTNSESAAGAIGGIYSLVLY